MNQITRENYKRCYRAWRKSATHNVMDVWRSDRAIYRAAGDSYVGNATDFHGWTNRNRWLKFVTRRMDIRMERQS